MTRYSIQPRDWIFVKDHGFLPFAKNMGKSIGKNISKSLIGKTAKNLLIMLKDLQQIQKQSFKKLQRQLVIWLVIKLLIKLWGFQKVHTK